MLHYSPALAPSRRRSERVSFAVPVTLCASGHEAVTSTLNLSSSGALVRPAPGLEVGQQVDVRVLLLDGPVALRARVVRAHREFWALEFLDSDQEGLHALGELVAERERALAPR